MKGKRWLLSVGLVLALMVALPSVAAAASKIIFTAAIPLNVVGPAQAVPELAPLGLPPMDTETEFEVKKDGTIKKVQVETMSEFITQSGPFTEFSCEPVDSALCATLPVSTLMSLHDSEATLKNVSILPWSALVAAGLLPPLPEPLATLDPTVLVGDIKGELEGVVTIQGPGPADVMQGEIKLKIRPNPDTPESVPDAVYGCVASLDPFVPIPLPVSDCQKGAGKMVALFLNIRDKGKVTITSTSGVFGDVDEAKAKLTVEVLGADGTAYIVDGKAAE